ncbi:MAG: hypothetical protein AAF698_02720 [Pseudomonadota bacterium]
MMTAHTASLINGLVLIACSAWAYVAAGGASATALIPAGFGLALLLCYQGVRAQNKVIAHIAAVLTLVVLVALVMPLSGAIGRGDAAAVIRVGLMLAATAVAMVFFVKSFIDARRAKT